MPIRKLALYNCIAFFLHLLVTFLTQVKIISHKNVGEVANEYPSLFTPATITFSIWALIYLSLSVFCIYHLLMAYRTGVTSTANKKLANSYPFFIINNLATIAWLIAWTNEKLLLSVLLIFVQLVTLIILHNSLCIHDATRSMASKICTQFPISIYFGWITVATVANISTWLTSIKWDGWGISAINWSITIIGLVAVIAIWVMNHRLNVWYGLVVIWGLWGIALKLTAIDKADYEPVIYVVYGSMLLIGGHILIALIRNLRKKSSPHPSLHSANN